MHIDDFVVMVATTNHIKYSQEIVEEMAESAKQRGTGIAKRSPAYVAQKMEEGKAIIALYKGVEWAGFCYIETWGGKEYVANSGLIVSPNFRKVGLAKKIKEKAFELSRVKYPEAKLFGLTTGLAVMKINSELGYVPVTYSELTNDESFWKGCESCVNFPILMSKERKNCLCTAMLFDRAKQKDNGNAPIEDFKQMSKLFERFMRLKKYLLLKGKLIKSAVLA